MRTDDDRFEARAFNKEHDTYMAFPCRHDRYPWLVLMSEVSHFVAC